VGWVNNRVNAFYQGPGGQLFNIWYDGSALRGPDLLAGDPTSISGSPSVVNWGSPTPNRLQVFVRGQHGLLMNDGWNGSNWLGLGQLSDFVFP
jgi:hypothetical protein